MFCLTHLFLLKIFITKGEEKMADKMIMEFNISINKEDRTEMITKNGKVLVIPFSGEVKSDLFCGKVRPGAADIQVTNPAGARHMCAKYIFEGTDKDGKPCHLFVENNGWFERNSMPRPFEATPTFMTDSEALADYLHGAHFRAEGWGRPDGVDIRIFDINQEA